MDGTDQNGMLDGLPGRRRWGSLNRSEFGTGNPRRTAMDDQFGVFHHLFSFALLRYFAILSERAVTSWRSSAHRITRFSSSVIQSSNPPFKSSKAITDTRR